LIDAFRRFPYNPVPSAPETLLCLKYLRMQGGRLPGCRVPRLPLPPPPLIFSSWSPFCACQKRLSSPPPFEYSAHPPLLKGFFLSFDIFFSELVLPGFRSASLFSMDYPFPSFPPCAKKGSFRRLPYPLFLF